MNIQQAKQALKEGKKVRHRSFNEHEWIKQFNNSFYVFEDGVLEDIDDFHDYRYTPEWQEDWSLFEE